MNKKTIKLEYSIPIKSEDGKEIQCSEISIGRVKAKHLKILPPEIFEEGVKISPAKVVDLIAVLADIPEESAGEIDIVDLHKVAEELGDFLEKSLGLTGEN